MSIHGICFDNGMSGRCDIECEVLADCDERLNIIDDAILNGMSADELIDLEIFIDDIEIYDAGLFREYLINKYIGEFRLGILRAQTKFEFNENEILQNAIYRACR